MKTLCAPVLVIQKGVGAGDRCILASAGSMVESYQRDHNQLLVSQQQVCVFEERKCNIYGLTYVDELDILFAYGEKSVAVIRQFSGNPQKQVFNLMDWIQSLRVFNKQEELRHCMELVVLSVNNAVQLFRLVGFGSANLDIEEMTSVKSDYRAVITHSLLDGNSWDTLRAVVGTVMGDIIISYPSKSSSPFHVLKHHTGMIFGLLIKCNFLFSISDDRSLHMWSVDNYHHLDECYGHSSRPFSICDGPQNVVFTGDQDGNICMWQFGESFISLLKLIRTGCGVIRSFLFVSRELFFGTDYGFFGSVTFPDNVKNMQTMNLICPDVSVQSFVSLSQQRYYILDSKGALYDTSTISSEKILQCSSAKFNSLKLSPCQKYVAFSEDKKLHVIRVEDRKCVLFNALHRILDFFWFKKCLFLVLFSFKNVVVHLSEDMSSWINYSLQIDLQEIVSCIAVHAEELFLGTGKGSIVVLHDSKMKQIIKRAHGKDSVTDVTFHKTNLFSIGRDGKLCIWKRENSLQLLSCSKFSMAIEMEWPCRFLETSNQLYVAGFRGSNFVLINYDSGHCVCDVWCGGRRRCWWLSVLETSRNHNGSKSLCFEFVIKRRISRIILYMSERQVIRPNLHLSNITSIAAIKIHQKELYITGGIDTMLVVFRFIGSGSVEVIQRSQAHSSSVHCVCTMDTYLVSVGGKSEIFVWRLEAGKLQQLFYTRIKADYRLLSAGFISVSPHIRFMISCSDGRVMIYELSGALGSKKYSLLFEMISEDGIMVKVSCASLKFGFLCCAVSSTGILYIWNFSESFNLKDQKKIEVEKCGLSALSIYNENELLYVGVGSESGTISIFEIKKNWEFTKSERCWHGATCTDLHLHRTAQSFLVFSIALDCRLAVFLYSPALQTLSFQQSVLLNTADPSSLIVSTVRSNVTKCVIAGTSICIVYFDESPLRFCDN